MKPTKQAIRLIHEGTQAMAKIQHNGIRINEAKLAETFRIVREDIKDKEKKIKSSKIYRKWQNHFGMKANVDSRDQLRVVLFDLMDYECKFRTEPTEAHPEGIPKVDAVSLEHINNPFIKDYFSVQKLKKLEGTYLKGIQREIVDGFLRPMFNLHLATTYRSSSSLINFQNLPIRDKEIGRMIRELFIPREGRYLGEVDFGMMEFIIAACKWKDKAMVHYASDPKADVHADQAMELFFLDKEQVDKRTTRDWAKNRWVFPILYGSYYISCATHIWEAIEKGHKLPNSETTVKEHLARHGITELGLCDPRTDPCPGTFEYHVKECQEEFKSRFPEWAIASEKWWNDYLKRGWFRMMTGFVCKGVYSRNFLMNADIQGPAFHCLLWCLIELIKWLEKYKFKSLVVGQIHDCMLPDMVESEMQDVLNKCYELMTVGVRKHWDWIITPLKVEVDVTPKDGSWDQKENWIQENSKWRPKKMAA